MSQTKTSIRANEDSVAAQTPLVPLAEGAHPIMVTSRLSAKVAAEFVLIQGWVFAAQQQACLAWRSASGDMAHFVSQLSKPSVVGVFNPINT